MFYLILFCSFAGFPFQKDKDRILTTWSLSWLFPNFRGHIIRIFNGCEVRIENSVTRVLFGITRLAEWCWTVSYPSDGIFNSHRPTIIDYFFFLTLPSTIVFKLEYALFFSIFDHGMFGSAPIYDILTSCTRSSYSPSCKTEIFRTGENRGKSCRVCKKTTFFRVMDIPYSFLIALSFFSFFFFFAFAMSHLVILTFAF